jgi:hypothetical protein
VSEKGVCARLINLRLREAAMNVRIHLNQQQYELLSRLRKERKLGSTDEEIIKNVLKRFLSEWKED